MYKYNGYYYVQLGDGRRTYFYSADGVLNDIRVNIGNRAPIKPEGIALPLGVL